MPKLLARLRLRPFWISILLLALGLGVSRTVASAESRVSSVPGSPPTMGAALKHLLDILTPEPGAEARTFTATISTVRPSEWIPKSLLGKKVRVAFQPPDKLRVTTEIDGEVYALGRDATKLWIHAASKKFGLVGSPDVPRFRTDGKKADGTALPPMIVPPEIRQVFMFFPLLFQVETLPDEVVHGQRCTVVRLKPRVPDTPENESFKSVYTFALRPEDSMPLRIDIFLMGLELTFELENPQLEPAWPDEAWALQPEEGHKIETVSVSHILRFLAAAADMLEGKGPAELGPATGDRRVAARHGKGRLEMRDGTRVLFLKGTPEEMGTQHGTLMKKEVHHLVDRMLYGVGVGSSFTKGRWFFGEIEDAQARLQPFVSDRHLREMDALAAASGIRIEEARLANFFPELFHCSGFALYGSATKDGRMYHGRILDYMKGVGLEQSACVIVMEPDEGHAWVNLGYAGFLGTVTAMNEKQIAIGEMGGKGEGHWDGKPMAQLLREVMEQAGTIEEAVEILRRGPRTCEYYYVISDGKTKKAVGIAATPTTFQTIWAGEAHPKLPHAIKDAVLMSVGDRYEALTQRVRTGYGAFEMESARDLMTRPVCMTSNIQSVLFAPETLDFWVANADRKNVASHTRYTHYNLRELLKQEPPATE